MVDTAASSIHSAARRSRRAQPGQRSAGYCWRNATSRPSWRSCGSAKQRAASPRRLRIRSRSSWVAASVKVTTRISGGLSGRPKAFSPPWSRTRRTYSRAMVNVLPVPALASIRRLPCNGKSSGSRATGICCWLMPAPPRHVPGQPAAARRAARPSARTHRWRAAGRSPDRPEPAPARRPPRPHAEPSLVALARLAHGFLGLCGATTGEPGESGPAGHRQRLAHALAPGVDQLVEVLAGTLAR